MRTANTFLSAAALAGLVAASPAPQQLDFAQLSAAPTVQTAPVLNGVANQTITISRSAIAASISAAVSTTATAISTAPANSAVNKAKRDIQKRNLNILCDWFGIGCYYGGSSTPTTSSSSSTSSSSVKATSTSILSASAAVKVASTSSSSSSSSSVAVSTTSGTSTVQSSSGTVTSSSTTACPTTPEDGTYCGFINPEDPCAPQPDGYGPQVTPDTVDAFLAYAPFHSMASAAPTVVASSNIAGNAYQQTFVDLNATTSANSYLGLYTLSSYNVSDCAAHCDSTALCTSFNIYIERDPSQNPTKNDSTAATVWGYWCPNPSSITNYKCTLWGSNIDASSATNQGGWREDFNVVVTGSSGYDATNFTFPPLVVDAADNATSTIVSVATSALSTVVKASSTSTGVVKASSISTSVVKASSTSTSAAATSTSSSSCTWSTPVTCNKKAINAPNYWMGSKFFPGPYNPQVCADYASYQHVLNKQAAVSAGKSSFTPCNSFNAYYLHKNGVPHGTYCALYDAQISTKYATYTGGYSGSDQFECKQSYTYTRNVQDSGRC